MTTITNVVQDSLGRVVEWKENNQTYRLDWNAANKPISLKLKNSASSEDLVVFKYTTGGVLIEDRDNNAPSSVIDDLYDVASGVTSVFAPNAILTLSEVTAYVTRTTTGTPFTGACEYAGYICTVAAGNITVYDALDATVPGNLIVPTTALALGTFPIFGAGTNGKLALTTGCHVVLSGAATVKVLVQ